MTNLNGIGEEYKLSHLEETDLLDDPISQFDLWMQEAIASKIKECNAMSLSTVNPNNSVSSRMVLLKYYDKNGFVFFSNYQSPKSKAIESHPQASALFWWPKFERQVIINGHVSKISPDHSDQYFSQRDKESNISAILSKQSQVLKDKQAFIDDFEQSRKEYANKPQLNRPDYWGGFCLNPDSIEFWQGGVHRMHDRLLYKRSGSQWNLERLYP